MEVTEFPESNFREEGQGGRGSDPTLLIGPAFTQFH